ncbi:MAG: DUF2330 domain-containing protein [Alphaproteobacteria bacterium]|nr:DUF2330 domain-containing protein [Alphaproteobacteria bacterium]
MLALLALLPAAQAFCGFFVSGAEAGLYNDATLAVLMREGTQTVLSMQNTYAGPPEDFALVVPVPEVLTEEDVRTLPPGVFHRVDALTAPRLVEYWEQDPCHREELRGRVTEMALSTMSMGKPKPSPVELGVTVEAEFEVAEYDIVILSAEDSAGLETWLRQERYNIPAGASVALRPYVEAGTKFFVAKVDVQKVRFEGDRAALSPLRMAFDSPLLSLPIRLGLLNAEGEQDLIVHVLGKQRYEVANYENLFLPTNIRVSPRALDRFGGFYDKLYRRAVQDHPRGVVTEYSWDARGCDPCPTPPLAPEELAALGADVMPSGPGGGWVLTRLHYRYDTDSLGEDLIFREAPPVVGGRGTPDKRGQLPEKWPQPSGVNAYQTRYVVLHPWAGPARCLTPDWGVWGPPPNGRVPAPMGPPAALSGEALPQVKLTRLLEEDVPELGLEADAPPDIEEGEPDIEERGGCSTGAGAPRGLAALLGLMVLSRRRWARG